MTAPLRVVQWATGNIGTRSLRAVIEHPSLELVGVYVHSEDKAGRDAGELCGLDPVGVVATNDVDDPRLNSVPGRVTRAQRRLPRPRTWCR